MSDLEAGESKSSSDRNSKVIMREVRPLLLLPKLFQGIARKCTQLSFRACEQPARGAYGGEHAAPNQRMRPAPFVSPGEGSETCP